MHKSKSVSLLAVRPAARRAEGSRMPRAVAAGGRLWGEAASAAAAWVPACARPARPLRLAKAAIRKSSACAELWAD